MSNENNTVRRYFNYDSPDDSSKLIDAKVDELISLIKQTDMDGSEIKHLHEKIGHIISDELSPREKISAFNQLDYEHKERGDILSDLEVLLTKHQLDNKISKRYLLNKRIKKASVFVVGVILLTLGFAMIIMPAPPYFEMFTIYYFSLNDGITLMDLISLGIVFTGIYLILTSILKTKPN